MTDIVVREIDMADDAELERFITFQREHGTPRFTAAETRAARPSLHAQLLLVAEADGELVGCGNANLHSASGGEPVMGNLFCLPGRSDVLHALIEHVRAWPEANTATTFYVYVSNPTSAMRDRLVEAGCTFGGDRFRLRRELSFADRGLEVPNVPGVEFTSMGERPDLALDLVELWNEATQDIPSPIEWSPMSAEAVRSHAELAPGDPWPPSMRIGVDVVTDAVVAFAALTPMPDSGGASYGHRMTGVARDRRGTGLATAVKLDALRWAARAGAQELFTTNDTDNVAMRAVNDRLGFQPVFVIAVYEFGLREGAPD